MVALGDDPQVIVAIPLGGLALFNRIGRQDAFGLHHGLIVQRLVLAADIALVATGMPVQAAAQVLRAASFNGSRGGHDLAQLGFGGESGGFGFLCHGLASFWFCDPSDRGRRKQGRCHEAGRHTPHTGAMLLNGEWIGQGVDGPPAPPRFRPRPIRWGNTQKGPRAGQGSKAAIQIIPSGLVASSTASSCSSTARTAGPRSG